MKILPPKLPGKLLSWYSDSAMTEDLLGDLDEVFFHALKTKGPFRAKLIYWKHALALIFSYGVRKRKNEAAYSSHYLSTAGSMWMNYFKISYRNLSKQKVFTLLNVVGFAMGMSVAVLSLVMYVELDQFDTFHESAPNTYRVTSTIVEDGDERHFASTPPALAELLNSQATGIKQAVRINSSFAAKIDQNGQTISAAGYFTEPSFFELFDFDFAEGNALQLNSPNAVVITKELATKLFGERNVLNEVIETTNWGALKIVGVLASFPKQTHFDFELVTGFATSSHLDELKQQTAWLDFPNNYYYLEVDPGQQKNVASQLSELAKTGTPLFIEEGKDVSYELQSLLEINLGNSYKNELGGTIGWADITLFFLISVIILIPACFNYSNMSIARSLNRSKEIGIRKVIGSQRKQIIEQFIVETIIICGISLVLSAYLFTLIRAEFLSMLTIGNSLTLEMSPKVILTFIAFTIATGILTGLVPAIYLSKISPINALKSTFSKKSLSISGIRKGLLVIQFISTLVLMTGIGVFVKQYQHSLTYNLGFHKENILVFPLYDQDPELIRNSFKSNTAVQHISFSSSLPGTPIRQSVTLNFPMLEDSIRVRQVFADDQFIAHMDLKLKWGKSLDNKSYQIEPILVNEKLMETIQTIKGTGEDSLLLEMSGGKKFQVVGVLNNYNHEPLDQLIEPLMIRQDQAEATHALVSIASDDLITAISNLENTWDGLFPNIPFNSSFLDDQIEASYAYFKTYLKIFGFLAAMAITVACLGLLGMVIYTTENRVKEIAIRKVLGATKPNLLSHLSGMYMKLWSIAVLIAVPLSYLVFDIFVVRYFNRFSNGVGLIELIGSVVITLGLAAAAIVLQINKTANINPVDNLRND